MKGPRALSSVERQTLYQRIARFPLSISEKDLALFIQNSRLDARLAEVVTEHIRDFWWKHEARALNRRLKAQPWPEAVRPMLHQILELCEGDDAIKRQFGKWASTVLAGIGRAHAQLYFLPDFPPRSRAFDREVRESLPSFTASGYLAREILFNKGRAGRLKASPEDVGPVLGREGALKARFLLEIRRHLKDGTLEDIGGKIGIDRTTLSRVRSGNIEKIGLKSLIAILNRLQ